MKTLFYLTVIFILFSIKTYSQKIEMNYYPAKKSNVSAQDYNKGIRDLAYAYADIERRETEKFDYIDYWRIAIAYVYMGIDKDDVYKIFLKSKEDNKQGFCIILKHQLRVNDKPIEESRLYKYLGKDYITTLNDCSGVNLEPVKSGPMKKPWLKKDGSYFRWNPIRRPQKVRFPFSKDTTYPVWSGSKLKLKNNN